MKLGMIGLGKMGYHMLAFMTKKHTVVVYNKHPKKLQEAKKLGAVPTKSIEEMMGKLGKQKIVWIMVPHGGAVDEVLKQVVPHMHRGDIVIDGGNSYYKDTLRRATALKKKGISFLDVGVSGGIVAAKQGYCMMAGGNPAAYKKIVPIMKSLQGEKGGYEYMGASGTGHYVKMVHNGIEYGQLQALGEGFAILHDTKKFKLNMKNIASIWTKGSVISGLLMDLSLQQFSKYPHLKRFPPRVGATGMGEWTSKEGRSEKIRTPVISAAFTERGRRDKKNFSAQVISALRNAFGGHIPPKR